MGARARCLIVTLFVLVLAACTDKLKPGRCNVQTDCTPSERCDPATLTCVDVARADAGDMRAARDTPGDGPDGAVDLEGTVADGAIPGPDIVLPDAAGTCADASHCTDPKRPYCVDGTCVGCGMATGQTCAALAPGKPACHPDGMCVECLEAAQCPMPGKSFCVANACVGCAAAGTDACKAATPVCDAAGGMCVECTAASHCKDAKRPFCGGNKCLPCSMAPAGQTCAALTPATPVCGPEGACVECNNNADCMMPGKPICQASRCVPCTSDAQCVAKLGANPGVCMAHADGRCATEAETIFVRAGNGCGNAGSAGQPACSLDAARGLVTGTRRLVVVRGLVDGFAWSLPAGGPVTIVGQQSAVISGGARVGAALTGSGEVVIRDVAISRSSLQGLSAGPGVTLRLERAVVESNGGGGILLDRARFDIRNTLVRDNGPGQQGAQVFWGGVLVQSPPAGGPARLERVSAINNRQVGISCSGTIQASGVLASGNLGGIDVTPACGIGLCASPGAECGASVTAP